MITSINEARKRILRNHLYAEVKKLNPKLILDNGCGVKGSFNYGAFAGRITKSDLFMGVNSENLPYKSNSFDLVIFAGVIQYLDNPDKAMEECYRVLKKNGTLIITTISTNSLIKKISGFREEKRSYLMEGFLNYLRKFNFKPIENDYIDFPLIPRRYKMILYCVCQK